MIKNISLDLMTLRTSFRKNNRDIYLVGGAVRDILLGVIPKDFDLCTDATPDEQIMIYRREKIRYIETGLQHGTVSVVLNGNVYEITSMRVDVETDGRHAKVRFGTNLDHTLLAKFETLGYSKDETYEVDELIKVFQHINQ